MEASTYTYALLNKFDIFQRKEVDAKEKGSPRE